jgi:pre-rRNA-processing protein TSR3
MSSTLPTIIVRHRKENKKKCSLRGIQGKKGFQFLSYPNTTLPQVDHYLLLDLDGPELTLADRDCGLILIDATWRYSERMLRTLEPQLKNVQRRSLPAYLRTAYPRRQEDCSDSQRGLASIEALYAAYQILDRPCDDILTNYHWKINFMTANNYDAPPR